MAAIVYKNFSGEIPRTEPHLLPPERAQSAVNCVFDSGALRPSREGLAFRTMLSNPIKGLYTQDGNLFYSWPVETHAFRAPLFDDEFNRIYFLQPSVGAWNVSTTLEMAINGPSPINVWKAGVPRPSAPPVLSLIDRTTLPDYPNVTVSARAWFVDSYGDKHNEAAATLSQVTPFKHYQVTPTSFPAPDTLDRPVLHVRLEVTDDDNDDNLVFAVTMRLEGYTQPGTSDRATSTSVPGSVEGWLVGNATSTFQLYLNWGFESTRAYTYTYRNNWEEEGPAADPATISPTYLQDVVVTVTAGDFTGYRPFLEYVVYRTFGGNSAYIEVETTPTGNPLALLDDSHNTTGSMGAQLESSDWLPAPTGLEGAEESPNGWFAAFKGATVYMSQPYRPHAWPYYQNFPSRVRGIKVGQDSIIVTTADGVYALIGAHPAAIQQIRLTLPQPGIAHRSMAQIDGSVAYASNDGIMLVSGTTGTSALNQRLLTREKWRDRFGASLDDASLMFNFHDGMLVGVSSARESGFLIRLDEDIGAYTTFNRRFDGMFRLPVTDSLYYSVGNALLRFMSGAASSFDWWGKDHILASRTFFGAGYIRCDGPVTFMLYADGVLHHTETLTTGHFRIRGGLRALRWSIRLQGQYPVHELAIATSMQELQGA